MAYDIHVFRGKDWFDGTRDPITEEELTAVNGVKKIESVSLSNPNTQETVRLSDKRMFSYDKMTFMLRKGMITLPINDESDIEIIRPLADSLKAIIQGDEGELY